MEVEAIGANNFSESAVERASLRQSLGTLWAGKASLRGVKAVAAVPRSANTLPSLWRSHRALARKNPMRSRWAALGSFQILLLNKG
jgi:hypothetical protein